MKYTKMMLKPNCKNLRMLTYDSKYSDHLKDKTENKKIISFLAIYFNLLSRLQASKIFFHSFFLNLFLSDYYAFVLSCEVLVCL